MAAFSAVLHRRRRGLPVTTSTRRKLCPLIGKLLGTRTPTASIKARQHHPIVSPRKVGIGLRLHPNSGTFMYGVAIALNRRGADRFRPNTWVLSSVAPASCWFFQLLA